MGNQVKVLMGNQAEKRETEPKGLHATLRAAARSSIEEAILAAAEQAFVKDGFEGARIESIASTARVSRKTLFNRFKSKESLLLSVLERVRSRLPSDFDESEKPHYFDPRDAIPIDMDKRLKAIYDLRWILTMAARHASVYDPGYKDLDVVISSRATRSRRIAAVQEKGGIRSDISPDDIGIQFDILRYSICRGWLLDSDHSYEVLKSRFDTAMKVFLRGLAPRDDSPKTSRKK